MESADGLKGLFEESGILPDSDCAQKLLKYLKLLKKWDARINLTGSTEWESLRPLFLEGIFAARNYPPEGGSHLDIGSGAGFPAIVLRILTPGIRLELVESRIKKSVFLETVAHALGLEDVVVHSKRLEVLLLECDSNKIWDCITWKGLKLSTSEVTKLLSHAAANTQFWMFHGREPAVKDPEVMSQYFRLLRREKSAGGKDWMLSIYSRQ